MTAAFRFGKFMLCPASRQLLVGSRPMPVGARAFDLLCALVERGDRVVTKRELLDLVWPDVVVEENNLQVQVSALRKVLGPEAIVTIPGRGYRLVSQITKTVTGSAQIADPALAVLAFVDLTEAKDHEYLAEGIAEELTIRLSAIRGLRVASRTSAFYFRGRSASLSTIAARLNVDAIVQGSLRRAGDRIRVSITLLRPAPETHLWSGTYEGDIRDTLALQDRVAHSVAAEVRPILLQDMHTSSADSRAAAASIQTTNHSPASPAAHRLYLQGRFFAGRSTPADTEKAVSCYQQAVNSSPEFALAWSGLGSAYATLAGYGGTVHVGEAFRQARAAVQRAITLEPGLARAHSILAWIYLYCDWDWISAQESAQRALDLSPDDGSVLRNVSTIFGNLGRSEESLALALRAVALDPLDAANYQTVAWGQLDAGELDSAEASLVQAMELDSRLALTHFCSGVISLARSRPDEALAMFRHEPLEDYRLVGLAIALAQQGCAADSDAALEQLIDRFAAVSPCQVAEAYAGRGELDCAFEWLERAYTERNPRLVETSSNWLFRPLQRDVRWLSFLQKLGISSDL